jgi:translation initiation factor IF-3
MSLPIYKRRSGNTLLPPASTACTTGRRVRSEGSGPAHALRGVRCHDWLPLGQSGSPFSFRHRLFRARDEDRVFRPTYQTGGHISTELRINERIRVPEVRLVGPNGETVGIVPTDQALKLAQEADLDLVEVAPTARPPVCKLMDYGKFKYENAQKAREARRNQTNVIIKEMKLRPKIDQHDYETKKGHVVRFLKAGDKVKITIMFRGREQHRPELGYRLLQKLAEDVTELGFVESAPKQDGRNMIMVLGPHTKKADAKAAQKAAKESRAAERAAEEAEELAERTAHNAGRPVAQKKERGRSENLDPEIEA